MKKILATLVLSAVFATACNQGSPSRNNNLLDNTSDKVLNDPQSVSRPTFNLPKSTSLTQDLEALNEAHDGWWEQSMNNYETRIDWFRKARFGCFVHWGVYAQAAGVWQGKTYKGYAEHLMRMAKIPVKTYTDSLVKTFNPDGFDAEKWMDDVAASGMKYFIITAKHHDGFAMFPSEAYPYDIRLTRYAGDPMRELRDAARKRGIKFGFYYSHAFDWEYPDAPGNDWEWDHPGGDRKLGGTDWWDGGWHGYLLNVEKYVKVKSIPQIQELVRNYDPDIMWFDTPGKLPLYLNVRILQALREVDKDCKIVVNGRLARFGSENLGDYKSTGDRAAYFYPVEGLWESIPTTNESYGYNAADHSHKSPSHFVHLLETAVSRGGNILMNVGPMGDGRWSPKDLEIFHTVGSWLTINGESIYESGPSPLPLQSWGVTTMRGDTLYLHVHDWPTNGKIVTGGLDCKVRKGWVVGKDGAKVSWKKSDGTDCLVKVSGCKPDSISTVIALLLEGRPSGQALPLLDNTSENVMLAFDATLSGGGFGFGDGKVNRNYVKNWKTETQSLAWHFRLSSPTVFDVFLDYNTASADDSGEIVLKIGDQEFNLSFTGFTEKQGVKSLHAGQISLPAGNQDCMLLPLRRTGEQYLQPISLRLVPLNAPGSSASGL